MAEVKNYGSIELNTKKGKRRNNITFQAESPAEKTKERMLRALERDNGRYVSFGPGCDGILIGAAYHEKAYQFIFIDKDRKVSYMPGTERYKLVNQVSSDLSVLNYIWTHDRKSILEYVSNVIDDTELITPIYIKIYNTKNYSGGVHRNKSKKKSN